MHAVFLSRSESSLSRREERKAESFRSMTGGGGGGGTGATRRNIRALWVFCAGVRLPVWSPWGRAHEPRAQSASCTRTYVCIYVHTYTLRSGLCKQVRFLRGLRIWVGHEVIVYNESALNRWVDAMWRSEPSLPERLRDNRNSLAILLPRRVCPFERDHLLSSSSSLCLCLLRRLIRIRGVNLRGFSFVAKFIVIPPRFCIAIVRANIWTRSRANDWTPSAIPLKASAIFAALRRFW